MNKTYISWSMKIYRDKTQPNGIPSLRKHLYIHFKHFDSLQQILCYDLLVTGCHHFSSHSFKSLQCHCRVIKGEDLSLKMFNHGHHLLLMIQTFHHKASPGRGLRSLCTWSISGGACFILSHISSLDILVHFFLLNGLSNPFVSLVIFVPIYMVSLDILAHSNLKLYRITQLVLLSVKNFQDQM